MSLENENSELTLEQLDELIEQNPTSSIFYEKRAMLNYKLARFHAAYNDFLVVESLDNENSRVKHYLELLKMVMGHEYRENINV